MKTTSIIGLAVLAALAVSTTDAAEPAAKKDATRVQKTEHIAAGAVGEHCTKLAAGQVVRYRFEADRPVDFNIHRHRGDEVIYAVQHEQASGAGFVDFKADAEADWCWMWTNKSDAAVQVRYTMFIAPPKRARK
jgi:hypothetical protein